MNLSTIKNKLPLIIGTLVILLVIFIVASFLLGNSAPKTANFKATSITPASQTLLHNNQTLQFSVFFDKEISANEVNVVLQAQNITTTDKPKNLEIKVEKKGTYQLLITSTEVTQPYYLYQMIITDKNKAILLTSSYSTENPKPSPIKNNNVELVKFLPYQADNYSLSYDPEQNLYIFDFLYDPNGGNYDTQFNKAKQDAIDFIKQKGIDPNSITIDWRYS